MIQSVQRAAQILAVLGSGTPRLGVTEIADRVGLAKPTVHGLLRTLEAHDLVAQDPDTGKYSLGPGVLQLGNAYLDGSELRARLEPYRAAIPSNHRRGRPLDSSRREEAPFPQRGGPQEGCATGQWTGWPRTPGTL